MTKRKISYLIVFIILSYASFQAGFLIRKKLHTKKKSQIIQQPKNSKEEACLFFSNTNNIHSSINLDQGLTYKNTDKEKLEDADMIVAVVFSEKSCNTCITKITQLFKNGFDNNLYTMVYIFLKDSNVGNASVRGFLGDNPSAPLITVNQFSTFPVELNNYPHLMLISSFTRTIILDLELNSSNEIDFNQKLDLIKKWKNL